MSELPGSGLWRAGRWFPEGTTLLEVVANEWYEPEYFNWVANQKETCLIGDLWRPHRLQPQDPAVIAALAAASGGIAAVDIAASTAAPGTFEDTASRVTVGQRAYRLLRADPRLDLEALG